MEINELPDERKLLADDDWLNDLAFLVDITAHLNVLNLKLQGANKLFSHMCNDVAAFKLKLQLFVGQLAQKRLDNFPRLKERATSHSELNTDRYTAKVEVLLESFQAKFSQFDVERDNVQLFSNPFTFPECKISSLDTNIQLEVLDLKCNSALKGRFYELPDAPSATDMVSFWRLVPASVFPHLHIFALQYVCRFGSTYRCEQTFSAMKLIKDRSRSCLTDPHLRDLLLLATSEIQPDIDKLSRSIQLHKSH